MPHQLPPLPYAIDALEPHIDARTMELHHDLHHGAYVTALNAALDAAPAALRDKSPVWLLRNLAQVPAAIRTDIRHQAGGHLNHSLLWTSMSPRGAGVSDGACAGAIARDFGSIAQFEGFFEQAGSKHFGAGWVWLVASSSSPTELRIMTTSEHDNPITHGYQPLLVNDLWEHAYYLKHENRRPTYLHEWWPLVDWQAVEQRYDGVMENAKAPQHA